MKDFLRKNHMNFQAVTLCIHDPLISHDHIWQKYTEWTCDLVKKYLNLTPKILDNEYYQYGKGDIPFDKITSIKLKLFDIFPNADRIFYFDSDWRPVRPFNLSDYCPSKNGLYFVEDRPFCDQLRIKYNMKNPYFNAGFFIADKKYKPLFDYAYDNYLSYDRAFVDQCVMNQVFDGYVTYLDKRLNVKDLGVFPNSEVLGYHNGHNYQIFQGNLPEIDWNC